MEVPQGSHGTTNWGGWLMKHSMGRLPRRTLGMLALAALTLVYGGHAEAARVVRNHTIEIRTISDTTALAWFASHFDVGLLYGFPNQKGYFQAQTLHQDNPNFKVIVYKDIHALQPYDLDWTALNGNYPGVQTTLASSIGTSDLTITLTNATGFPTSNFWIRIDTEVIEIASRSGNTLTVRNYNNGNTGRGIATIRSVDGGGNWGPFSHSVGAPVYLAREDFFLHDRDNGSRLYYGKYGWYHMDVANPNYRAFWAQEVLSWITTYVNTSTTGLDPAGPHVDGVFADDCWSDIAYAQGTNRLTRVKDDVYGNITQAKVDSFHTDMLNMIAYVKQVLGTHLLIENGGGGYSQDYADACDGAMHEQWMHAAWTSASTDPSESLWLAAIQAMQGVTAMGKYFLAQDNLSYTGLPAGRDTQVFMFGYASYLLATDSVYINQTKTSFRHLPYVDTTQTDFWTNYYYPIYDFDPGSPLGPYYLYYQNTTTGAKVYARDYTNALVLVNPAGANTSNNSALDVTLSLNGSFQPVASDGTLGAAVTTYLLQNKYGAVLARTVPTTSPNVSLQLSCDHATASPGSLITYTFTYKNTGTASASGFAIIDVLPSAVRFVSGSAQLNGAAISPDPLASDGVTVQVPVGTVAAGQQGTLTFQVQVQ